MFLIASAVALAVIAAAGTIVATRLLRPLRQMRETAEQVSAHSLSERLPIIGRDDVSELTRTMNDMLDRWTTRSTRSGVCSAMSATS